jgi:ABC-type maltose transport system permease subunit
MSATTYFSNRKTNVIAPVYSKLLEIVCDKRLERIEVQPFFLTERHIPKQVSRIIVNTASKTRGVIGLRTERLAKRNALTFVDILENHYSVIIAVVIVALATTSVTSTYAVARFNLWAKVGVLIC